MLGSVLIVALTVDVTVDVTGVFRAGPPVPDVYSTSPSTVDGRCSAPISTPASSPEPGTRFAPAPAESIPQDRPADGRRQVRGPRVRRLPARPLVNGPGSTNPLDRLTGPVARDAWPRPATCGTECSHPAFSITLEGRWSLLGDPRPLLVQDAIYASFRGGKFMDQIARRRRLLSSGLSTAGVLLIPSAGSAMPIKAAPSVNAAAAPRAQTVITNSVRHPSVLDLGGATHGAFRELGPTTANERTPRRRVVRTGQPRLHPVLASPRRARNNDSAAQVRPARSSSPFSPVSATSSAPAARSPRRIVITGPTAWTAVMVSDTNWVSSRATTARKSTARGAAALRRPATWSSAEVRAGTGSPNWVPCRTRRTSPRSSSAASRSAEARCASTSRGPCLLPSPPATFGRRPTSRCSPARLSRGGRPHRLHRSCRRRRNAVRAVERHGARA